MKSVYGPVPSWRLGKSLGIDTVCAEGKTCSFDCIYCQLGKTIHKTNERRMFVETERVRQDLKDMLKKTDPDVVTVSGTGEPTLAANLGEIADMVREVTDLPLAILTDSSLMIGDDVRKDLNKFDIVVAKLDAPNQNIFEEINQPLDGITLKSVLDGIKRFRKEFKGYLALQMMFVEQNKGHAKEIAELARAIKPNEVQLNTPLRPCPVKP